jgi:hypothetical protein
MNNEVSEWESEHTLNTDSAAKGNSCLKAALSDLSKLK